MIKRPVSHRHNGFSLIEALIAVVILATGLLALTALQSAIIRNSADAKARSLLASYASSRLEQIRAAQYFRNAASPATGEPYGLTNLPASISTTSNVEGVGSVQETITVRRFVAMAGGAFTENNDASDPDSEFDAYYKDVSLALAWTDATGGGRQLSMRSTLSPLTLAANDTLVDRPPPGDELEKPIVRRRTPVTDGMIPIALGDSEDTAATNPKPQLLGGDGTYVADTAFDVLTYNTADNLGNSEFVRFDKRIETRLIGCTCQNNTNGYNGNGQGSGFLDFLALRAFRPAYWDGEEYKEPAAATYSVSTSPADVAQSPLCDVCCRDHKDPASQAAPLYSPWPGQDADHYQEDGTTLAAQPNDVYREACRVIRVNGVFRVAADPKIQDVALVPTRVYPSSDIAGSLLPSVSDNNAATSPMVDDDGTTAQSNGTDAYVAYVFNYVRQVFHAGVASTNPYNVDVAAIQQSRGLNSPSYIPLRPSADTRWMHARALVTDFLEPEAVARIGEAKAANQTGSPCLGTTDQDLARCVLPYSPFATVNVTEISNWAPRSATGDDAVPDVLAQLETNYLNYATASISRYNSGLALIGAINADDGAAQALDEQLFVRLSALPPATTPWLTTPNPNPTTARFFGNTSNPMRGYAQSSPPIPFFLSWNFPGGNPPSPVASDINDPTGSVVNGTNCTVPDSNNTSTHNCSAGEESNIAIRLAGYNRVEQKTNVNNPCGTGRVTKPVCVVYTFTGATVNTAPQGAITASPYPLYSGTQGRVDEVIAIAIPSISGATTRTVTVSFTRSEPATTNTCNGTTPVWTVPCQ